MLARTHPPLGLPLAHDLHGTGSALLNISGGVPDLLGRGLSEQDMNSERRKLPFLSESDSVTVALKILLTSLNDLDLSETHAFEQRHGL